MLVDKHNRAQAIVNAREASATALALDPDSSLAHGARAFLLRVVLMDWPGAETEYRHALQLAPNSVVAQVGLAGALATLGHNARAAMLTRNALASDPRNAESYFWLSNYLAALGRLDEAEDAARTAMALQPGSSVFHMQFAVIAILRGDPEAALATAKQEPPGHWHDYAMALALQIGDDRAAADAALKRLIADYAHVMAYQIADVYALRREPDAMFHWLDRAWAQRDDGVDGLLFDPLILRYRDDPRFTAFCNKIGLPETTDAVTIRASGHGDPAAKG